MPSPTERIFNRIFGFFVGLGLGFPYNYLLQLRGRKSGEIYSTAINLLELRGKRFPVALAAGHNGFATPKPPEKSR